MGAGTVGMVGGILNTGGTGTGTVGMVGGVRETGGGTGTGVRGVLETGGGTWWTGGAWETETVYTGAYGILNTGGTGKVVGGVLDTGGTGMVYSPSRMPTAVTPLDSLLP